MKRGYLKQSSLEMNAAMRLLADQAFSRAAGAPLIQGNQVRLLKDATENYPAWLAAMRAAQKTIHFETYIIQDDTIGYEFAHLMAAKARAGVKVRLIYDWLGCLGKSSRGFWKELTQAGVEVRCFNPPHIDHPLSWMSRDHRKMLTVDGQTAFVSGLCVGRLWAGYPEKGTPPWRDTGVMIQGPAVADIEQSFAEIWAAMGAPLPADQRPRTNALHAMGDVSLRVIASVPNTAGLFKIDQLISATARRTLWLTDAYFLGFTPYIQGLMASARDGVDVRLLVPGTTDLPILRAMSRAGYHTLLSAGVRIFEWNGPMLHAKTAVADSRWARIGSSNLNISSWLGNYELDVAIEDGDFALAMERLYLEDLTNSTEIVLDKHHAANPIRKRPRHGRPGRNHRKASIGRAGAGFIRAGRVVEAAITNRRILGPADSQIMLSAGLILLALAVVALIWPRVLAIPLALISAWFAFALLRKAYRIRLRHKHPQPPLQDHNAYPDRPPGDSG